MSAAKKCDKCGAYYTPNNYKLNLIKKEHVGFDIIDKYVDLCPDCQEILEEWMETPDKSYILLNSNAKKLLFNKITAECFEAQKINGIKFQYGVNIVYTERVLEILKEFDLVPEEVKK